MVWKLCELGWLFKKVKGHVSENIEELAKQLENASPLETMDKALEKFGNDIAITFSGAEDVVLIEYAKLIVKVQGLVRAKGLFLFYEDGQQECCRVRKVIPLRRALKGLKAWITSQRKDQSSGTRSEVHVVQVDPVFEGVGSLIKWNPVANVDGCDIWNFLRAMDVPVNMLHSQGYVSIGCKPCTRPILPGQHEREGRMGIENLAKMGSRKEPWIVVLYAPWCQFCQKVYAQQELQLGSFLTILFFPKHSSQAIKYPSEKRDVDSLLAFVNALR
ncbi:hypothetical protein IFM89_021691 [Coptis chinensis]|uniref:Phosphoadenosine phosphosulphate reductase domain-containing protein n=1 Tax=Coptis chinensis TaxID=261450 RepID=A0A835LE92_9MAGN|nr:hypothetical protein IFM89_021691 [Coptis chinensis]